MQVLDGVILQYRYITAYVRIPALLLTLIIEYRVDLKTPPLPSLSLMMTGRSQPASQPANQPGSQSVSHGHSVEKLTMGGYIHVRADTYFSAYIYRYIYLDQTGPKPDLRVQNDETAALRRIFHPSATDAYCLFCERDIRVGPAGRNKYRRGELNKELARRSIPWP